MEKEMGQNRSKIILFFLTAFAITVADQITKEMVRSTLHLFETISVIPGLFNLTHLTNKGAAFGILAKAGEWRELFFQVVSVAAMGGLTIYFVSAEKKDRLLLFSTAFILGGALGNFIDRVRVGHVTDFLDFYVGRYHWPAFNIADSAITVGGLLLAIRLFKEPRKGS